MNTLSKLLFTITAVAALALAYPASVQAVPTTYQYTGNPFTNVGAPYTTSDFVTGMVTLSGPLAPNMGLTAVTPTAFSVSDGVQTITNLNATMSLFEFATGPTGAITGWDVAVTITIGTAFITLNDITIGDAVESAGGSGLNSKPGTWVITGAVPDSGSTLSLMTLTLMALGLVARRFQRAAACRAKAS